MLLYEDGQPAAMPLERDTLPDQKMEPGEAFVADSVLENLQRDISQTLVTRALERDELVFYDIMDLYGGSMLRTASLIVRDHDVAEDVVQEALILAWRHLPELRDTGALRPWLMRIVVNQCLSSQRRVARTAAFLRQACAEHEIEHSALLADDEKGCRERDWDLAHTIERLPVEQRVVIVLHYYNGLTIAEMADTLHISKNTLKKRLQAALKRLRQLLHVSGEHILYSFNL